LNFSWPEMPVSARATSNTVAHASLVMSEP